MNDRKAADALLATLWVFRDLIAREAGDYAGLRTAVEEAVRAVSTAEMVAHGGGNAAVHFPTVKEKVACVDDAWFLVRHDLTDPLIPMALHAVVVAFDAFEATVKARATDCVVLQSYDLTVPADKEWDARLTAILLSADDPDDGEVSA